MDNKLFLMNNGRAEKLEIQTKGYENERFLQEIIRDNPYLLERSLEGEIAKKLYLIKRELSVKVLEDGYNYYSLDHLMVDEDGIPVLVEVKRSTDTRIKREVVAQMLDYASSASKWNVEELKRSFLESNPEIETEREEMTTEAFWKKVETNLSVEHLRLVFAADEIPDTLRVLIEFLDRSMKDIEVYGVELKPYKTGNTLLLASNIIGNSLLGSTKASSSGDRESRTYTIEEFKEEFKIRDIDDVIEVFTEIYEYGQKIGLTWESGNGSKHPSYIARIGKNKFFRILLWNSTVSSFRALVEIPLAGLSKILNRSKRIEDLRISFSSFPNQNDAYISGPEKMQYINLRLMKDKENIEYFKSVIKELADDIIEMQEILY